MSVDPSADLDALFASTRRELERMSAVRQTQEDPRQTGTGYGADGRVKARMGADGRLVELTLDEQLRELDMSELAREIFVAVNEAWATSRGVNADVAAVGAIDPEALNERLRDVQSEGLMAMRRYTQSLAEAVERIERRTR